MYEAKIKGSEFTFRGDLVHELSTGRTFLVDLDHFENDTPVGDILVEVEPDTVVKVRERKPVTGSTGQYRQIIKYSLLFNKQGA